MPFDEAEPGAFLLTLPGERRHRTLVWLLIGDHELLVESFVCRQPDENHQGVYRYLLQRNAKLRTVAYCLDALGDIHLVGRLGLATLSAAEIDTTLGVLLAASDADFNPILERGFADLDPPRVGVAVADRPVAEEPAGLPAPRRGAPGCRRAAATGRRRVPDAEWNRDERDETATQRLDRNWTDLLQELRVVQTGVQVLTGFLLTLPFQQRFTELTAFGRVLYLVTVAASVLATGLLVAPVMIHRLLFRRHARAVMVTGAHRMAVAGTSFLGVALTGVVLLVADVVFGRTAGHHRGVAGRRAAAGPVVRVPLALRHR